MDTIAERLRKKHGMKSLAVFNSLKSQIIEAFADERTIREVFDELKETGAIGCSYRQFCRYVSKMENRRGFTPDRKYVSGAVETPNQSIEVATHDRPTKVHQQANSGGIASFEFKRIAEEDLI